MRLIKKPTDDNDGDYLLIHCKRDRKGNWALPLSFEGETGIFSTFMQFPISITDKHRGITVTIKPRRETYFRVYGTLRDFAILDSEFPDSWNHVYIHRSYLPQFINSPIMLLDVASKNWDSMYGFLFDLDPDYPSVAIIRAKHYERTFIYLDEGNDKELFFNYVVGEVLDNQKVIGIYTLIKDKLTSILLMLDDKAKEFIEKLFAATVYIGRQQQEKGAFSDVPVLKAMLDNLDEYSRLGREYLDSKQKPIVNTS
jgi:hypothetical protein